MLVWLSFAGLATLVLMPPLLVASPDSKGRAESIKNNLTKYLMKTHEVNPRTKEGRLIKLQKQMQEFNAKYGANNAKSINTKLAYFNLLSTIKN